MRWSARLARSRSIGGRGSSAQYQYTLQGDDLDALNQTPRYNIYSNLVYATKAADVPASMLSGSWPIRGGRWTRCCSST